MCWWRQTRTARPCGPKTELKAPTSLDWSVCRPVARLTSSDLHWNAISKTLISSKKVYLIFAGFHLELHQLISASCLHRLSWLCEAKWDTVVLAVLCPPSPVQGEVVLTVEPRQNLLEIFRLPLLVPGQPGPDLRPVGETVCKWGTSSGWSDSCDVTVLPQVDHLVETSQLCSPVAQQDRVLRPQVELFSTQREEFSHVFGNQIVCSVYYYWYISFYIYLLKAILNLNSYICFDGLEEENFLPKLENFWKRFIWWNKS